MSNIVDRLYVFGGTNGIVEGLHSIELYSLSTGGNVLSDLIEDEGSSIAAVSIN
jgi:hypothetical protein